MKVAERGLRELVIFLIDNGAEVSKASGVEGITALMRASKKGHYETVTFLLEKEAEVDTIDKVWIISMCIVSIYIMLAFLSLLISLDGPL